MAITAIYLVFQSKSMDTKLTLVGFYSQVGLLYLRLELLSYLLVSTIIPPIRIITPIIPVTQRAPELA